MRLNHHPRGERVVFARDGGGQLGASTAALEFRARRSRQNFEETSWHDRSAIVGFTADKERRIVRARDVL